VSSTPADRQWYHYIRFSELTGKKVLAQGVKTELTFDISTTPLPIWANDVHMFISYKKEGDPDAMTRAVGYLDLPEATPVDVFNNTDYTCANGQWYPSGSPALFQLKYNDTTFLRDVRDLYPHNVGNLSFWVESPEKTVFTSPAALAPNTTRRLGYILIDPTFTYGINKDYLHTTNPEDPWFDVEDPVTPHPGTAVINNSRYYPGMFNIRGKLMWGDTGIVYDNEGYRLGWSAAIDDSCSWDNLPLLP
jgi:hypothetical protein